MWNGFTYNVIWTDDTQSYTGYTITNLTLLLNDGRKLPIDKYRLKKECPELYE